MKADTFARLVSTALYEHRFGPFFVTPIVVGLDDGASLGALVGVTDGCAVGLDDGTSLGASDWVGDTLGPALGALVGLEVGLLVVVG